MTEEKNSLIGLSAKIRSNILSMLKEVGYGHVGGFLSIVELLAVLYGKQMNYDSKNLMKEDRDWLVLSKGYAGQLYIVH